MNFLCIDIGNTRAKAAVFDESGKPSDIWSCELADLEQKLAKWLTPFFDTKLIVGWISTAGKVVDSDWELWRKFSQTPHIESITPTDEHLPIAVAYDTPHTLGADRLVAAVAACSYFPDKPVLVIDAGTAITYDCVDTHGSYLGGGISPGVRMRFQALHTFTARLPLVAPAASAPLLGTSTETSMQAGAQRGAIAEVKGMIKDYRRLLGKDLKVFLTGGDSNTFEKHLKKLNFARYHLLLEGIYLILKHRLPII
ncbi:MAG: type III pantothenate kinase [Bacteroidia bacterium]